MPSNYGQARLTIESHTAGQVRVDAVHSLPALAPRIQFRLAWTLSPIRNYQMTESSVDFRVLGVDGEIRLGEQGPAVGQLFQLGERHPLRALDYADEQQMELVLDLDWFRFERLEEHRQGGPLTLWMKLWPNLEAKGLALVSRLDPFAIRIPREDWLEVVSQVSGDRTDLLEVRYHLSYAGRFQPSLGELAQARKAVDRGESVTALIHTRKALLLAEDASREEPSTSLEQLLASRVDERHAKAYAGIAGRIKELGNIQAHTVTGGNASRVEVLFAIRTAEGLWELVAGLLAQRPQLSQ